MQSQNHKQINKNYLPVIFRGLQLKKNKNSFLPINQEIKKH